MDNFFAKFGKILDVCKHFSKDLVNEHGKKPRRGFVPKFSDLEVITLSLTAETESIDSENRLCSILKSHKECFPKPDFTPPVQRLSRVYRQSVRGHPKTDGGCD